MRWLAAILLFAGCSYFPAPRVGDPVADYWSDYADGVDDAEVSAALVRDGVPVFAGDPRAIYRIGSLTDFFVLEAINRLADRGAIELDYSVAAYVGYDLDGVSSSITLRELLEFRRAAPEGEAMYSLATRFPWTSDARVAIVAAIVEDTLGRSLAELVRDEVTLPLQLRDTAFTPSADKLPRLVTRGDKLGGLCSSVEDCVKFFASSERVRASLLLRRGNAWDIPLDFHLDRVVGARRFLAFSEGRRDFVLVFRNAGAWTQYPDFKFAAEVLSE